MRWKEQINADEVCRAIAVLQEPGKVFEVRAIGTAKKDILSGYFRDAKTLLRELDKVDARNRNFYITLGEVKDECFARAQSERFLKNSPTSSSDTEIVRYRWLFVDLDPVRSAGISSSDSELSEAMSLAKEVNEYLLALGFKEPVKALSGNGCHLLYRINIENDKAGRSLVERCLKALAERFDSGKVKIDTTNSNPSRICKLHGTLAQKGTSTPDRPYRMSRLVYVPDKVEITQAEILQKLADEIPEQAQPQRSAGSYGGFNQPKAFDLLGFMADHGMSYEEDSNDRARIFKLDECPFDSNHKNGDAKIFLYNDGKIAFKCHHNSCRDKRWQDVRIKYEPGAYDRKEYEDREETDRKIDAGWQTHLLKKAKAEKEQPKQDKKKKEYRKLKTAEALMQKVLPEPKVFIGAGEELPILVEGTCILSAKPKLGKSWLALSMCLAVANGDDFLGYHTNKCSTLYLDLETSEQLQQKRLRKCLDGKPVPKNFYLETETDSIENGFVEQIEHYLEEDPEIGVVVIDVFQIIRSPAKGFKETEYEHAYRDITPLNELAQKHHISIILVCHDRKAVDPDDPFSNILGSTGLQGAATQMIVMFKKTKDDPIHISVKGKTIDGLPELNVSLDNAKWSLVSGSDLAGRAQEAALKEYMESDVRQMVLAIAENNIMFRGRCREMQNLAVEYGIGFRSTAKQIGGFLHKYQGLFMSEDGIQIGMIRNGTGPTIYSIKKFTIDTIDDDNPFIIDETEKPHNYAISGIPLP